MKAIFKLNLILFAILISSEFCLVGCVPAKLEYFGSNDAVILPQNHKIEKNNIVNKNLKHYKKEIPISDERESCLEICSECFYDQSAGVI